MADYPEATYDPRTKENKAGVVYAPLKTTVSFAEDISKLDAEVVAIENDLRTNTKYEYIENLSSDAQDQLDGKAPSLGDDDNYVTDDEKTDIGNLSGENSGDETTTTIGSLIDGADAKTTPVDADMVGLMDSAASKILKKLSWTNIKATLKTYFDTLYASVLGGDDNYVTDAQKSALHAAGSDTSLGTGAVAKDHGTATTDQVGNICYGTSATPPTASGTTEGTIYAQYTV